LRAKAHSLLLLLLLLLLLRRRRRRRRKRTRWRRTQYGLERVSNSTLSCDARRHV